MADDKGGSNINVDFGIKAQVTANIPDQSAGKFVDAITDIIRPLSEWTGFRADLIRLRREDVLT